MNKLSTKEFQKFCEYIAEFEPKKTDPIEVKRNAEGVAVVTFKFPSYQVSVKLSEEVVYGK